MSHFKTVFRTLFYQFFILFIGISIGFISNPEWFGLKTNIIAHSFENIFYQIKFDKDVCNNLKKWGAFKIWSKNYMPNDFTVIEEGLLAEEIYVLKYSYTDNKGKKQINIDSIRLRWKPWEYYYELPDTQTDEEMIEYMKNGTLNSKETDKALRLIQERKKLEAEKNID